MNRSAKIEWLKNYIKELEEEAFTNKEWDVVDSLIAILDELEWPTPINGILGD